MASVQQFRKRIKSIQNTRQITKAMEMVASVKMQKAVKSILEARSYVQNSWNMLLKLANLTLPENHPLTRPKEVGKTVIVFITSDRGLSGSYNSDLLKKLTAAVHEQSNPDIIAVGKKGADYVKKYELGNLVAVFDGMDNNISPEAILPIAKLTMDEYLANKYDKVVIIYSYFASSLAQTPVVKKVLPIDRDHIDLPDLWEQHGVAENNLEYKLEPDAATIVDRLLARLIRMQLYGALLEANASKHSAQMVAMKSATDNAKELIDELTLTYNSVRQASITREIAEIAGAAEAMK
jgi:F-type H+-transporting ATPase subunit gamma